MGRGGGRVSSGRRESLLLVEEIISEAQRKQEARVNGVHIFSHIPNSQRVHVPNN